MEHSETLGHLAAALVKAQAAMPKAQENATNPFLRNKYADLDSVWEAARGPLAANGLSVAQFPTSAPDAIGLTTILLHESGEWISDTIYLPVVDEKGKSLAQVAGSIISYLRRYGISAVLGITTGEDDDGNAGRDPRQPQRQPAPRKTAKETPANGSGETPAALPPADDEHVFYGGVLEAAPWYGTAEKVRETMAALGMAYPDTAPQARAARKQLVEHAQQAADESEEER